ncbi:Biofilm growth-associated repressor [Ensifer sp. M14]|uniref:Winged helix-turn-helix transcriptional regulator n=1 Tax=Ensifer oleiphilus TaxID=2742698 RepID=A0A7Y6QBW4_9HYPH|nr:MULTISPECIES: ArsR family transcriptional regulator [Ensifer]NVD42808.1 winged helix-turn-helix transcriptional regulator [Ensifer oleiphilus]RDL46811.1 Biofilm growth-associated repressor [Ensifer sp. M14]
MTLSEWSEDRARDAAQFLQAIAHPTRLLLLLLLAERQLPASKLARAVGVSQPAAFRHLRCMVEAGILSINTRTASMTFAIASPTTMRAVLEMSAALSAELNAPEGTARRQRSPDRNRDLPPEASRALSSAA